MKLPINIVILTPGFAADEQDTTAIPALQLYTRFLGSHFDDLNIRIVAFQYPFKSGSYTWKGLTVYSAGGMNRKFTKILTWMKVLVHLFRLRKKSGIDIIHSFWLTEASLAGLVFCRLTGTSFLATAMGQDVKAENKYLRILRFFPFDLTVISPFQQEFVKNFKKANVLNVIPFGIDRSYFPEQAYHRTIDILGVGSLNSIKNYAEFVEIIESVTHIFPGIRCKIVGEGIKRAEIEKIIAEKGFEDNIILAGSLSYEKAIEEMHHGKILVHTSTFEGQALVITEALAAGLYVVSHPVGIAAALESKKLFTGNTSHELAGHILAILQNRDLDFTPEIHFTMDETCREYYYIYQALPGGKRIGI